jgi:hypothetical protein
MRRITSAIGIPCLLLSACSGSIYHETTIPDKAAHAISVDARQRVILSQIDKDETLRAKEPAFRRFCAEPSPDMFTVLGVAASGSASLALNQDPKSLNAALQAAFSSSEAGTTIPRTQTINMLREMMFRTCERYLSGAIDSAEFQIVAARDQRIMVSILAIEQLTGAVTAPAVAITADGDSATGYDPSEMVKELSAKQEELAEAQTKLEDASKALEKLNGEAPKCDDLAKKKADGATPLTTDETTKLGKCDGAKQLVDGATQLRDTVQKQHAELVEASKRGLGVSTAATKSSIRFASSAEHEAAVVAVSRAVERIVQGTFDQDETQLFCIRAIAGADQQLTDQCLSYLLTKVEGEKLALSRRYKVPVAQVAQLVKAGTDYRDRRQKNVTLLKTCLNNTALAKQVTGAIAGNTALSGLEKSLREANTAGESTLNTYLYRLGIELEGQLYAALSTTCGLGT